MRAGESPDRDRAHIQRLRLTAPVFPRRKFSWLILLAYMIACSDLGGMIGESAQDLVRGLVQVNGLGLSFQVAIQSLMFMFRGLHRGMQAARISLSASRSNHRSTWCIHDEPVGVEMDAEARVPGQPGTDLSGAVGGVVVADQVYVQAGGHGLVDRDEDLAELDGAVPAISTTSPRRTARLTA
jgi:hypothetical protein